MKQIILLLLISGSLVAQPNKKNAVDSVKWLQQQLIEYANGVAKLRGSLLDNNKNFITNRDVVTIDNRSTGNNVYANRSATITNSHSNTITGENVHIENSNGCMVSATDATIINSLYATVSGDAHRGRGEGYTMSGFGSINVGDFNTIMGNSNSIGEWGIPTKYNNSSAIGTGIKVLYSNCHAFGINFTAPGEGFGYGFNGRILFWVTPNAMTTKN